MSIKDNLKAIGLNVRINDANVFKSAFYGDDYEANTQMTDDCQYPLCHVAKILTAGFAVNPKTGSQLDSWNVFIFFCDKTPVTDLDTTADLNDEVIERMRVACKVYVNDMIRSGLYSVPTKVEMKNLFFQKDACISGVLAYFVVTEMRAGIICPPEPLI